VVERERPSKKLWKELLLREELLVENAVVPIEDVVPKEDAFKTI
jgi:hypothetical protein